MQIADRGFASPSSTRLDFHYIDAVLALHRPIQRNLGVVRSTSIPAVPLSDEALHEALLSRRMPATGACRLVEGLGRRRGSKDEAYHAAWKLAVIFAAFTACPVRHQRMYTLLQSQDGEESTGRRQECRQLCRQTLGQCG